MIGGITQAINQLWFESKGRGRGRGQEPKIDAQTLRKALEDAGVVNRGEIVKCLDCRPFNPKDYIPGAKEHCGSWPGSIKACVNQVTEDPVILSRIAYMYQEALQASLESRSKAPIVMVFYCRSGKHRSVAMATIVQHLFEAFDLPRPSMEHSCAPHWINGYCSEQCKEPFF